MTDKMANFIPEISVSAFSRVPLIEIVLILKIIFAAQNWPDMGGVCWSEGQVLLCLNQQFMNIHRNRHWKYFAF